MKKLNFKIELTLTAICIFLLLCSNSIAQGWESITTPVQTNLILYDISFPNGQNDVGYVGGSNVTWNGKGTILKTTNQGSSWDIVFNSDISGTGLTSIFFLSPDHGFAGTMDGSIMTTTDGGMNWNLSDIDPNVNTGEVGDLEFYDATNGVTTTLWGGIYITTDGGANWSPAISDNTGAKDITYADANNLFAVSYTNKIYKSSDKGLNWSENYSATDPFLENHGIHFSDANNGLVVGSVGNVFVTTDGGGSWNHYVAVGSISTLRGAWVIDADNMYATGSPGQAIKSVDGGVNWTLDSAIDPNPAYYKIKFTENGTGFVCGSGSNGGTILRKLPLSIVNVATSDVSCNGGNDGSISIEVSGGFTPYTYLWSNNEMTQNISGLSAGNYTCTITDSTGTMVISDVIAITEPAAIELMTSVTDESEFGANDGAIDLTVNGGTPGYTYLWNNGATTQNIANLAPGDYCVTITDANGCTLTNCETVMEGALSSQSIEEMITFTVSPNPVTGDNIWIELQFSSKKEIQLNIFNALGKEVYSLKKENVDLLKNQIDFSAYSPGIYFIKVTSLKDNQIATQKIVKR